MPQGKEPDEGVFLGEGCMDGHASRRMSLQGLFSKPVIDGSQAALKVIDGTMLAQ